MAKPKYKKLLKHPRDARDDTKSFSKNTGKDVYTYGDGAKKIQSQLDGKYHTFNKKGREIKNR